MILVCSFSIYNTLPIYFFIQLPEDLFWNWNLISSVPSLGFPVKCGPTTPAWCTHRGALFTTPPVCPPSPSHLHLRHQPQQAARRVSRTLHDLPAPFFDWMTHNSCFFFESSSVSPPPESPCGLHLLALPVSGAASLCPHWSLGLFLSWPLSHFITLLHVTVSSEPATVIQQCMIGSPRKSDLIHQWRARVENLTSGFIKVCWPTNWMDGCMNEWMNTLRHRAWDSDLLPPTLETMTCSALK